MKNSSIITNPAVEAVFNNYPDVVLEKVRNLRRIILETASEIASIQQVEETLKWGEPSYLVKNGSTVRIDWKAAKPDEYAIYFKCTSKLVPTFRELYGDLFHFDGNRAIVFQLADGVPEQALKKCIAAALTYHKVKHLSSLGLN